MLSDRLRLDEVKLTERAIRVLDTVAWGRPVIQRLRDAGGFAAENKSRMFEVRVAYELHLAGAVARYEYRTGEGELSVDFYVSDEPPWLIEVLSLGKSEGMRRATHQDGPFTVLSVGDDASDPKQTEVGELLTTQGKIAEKALKFSLPSTARHAILVDTRAYLDNGGDRYDARELVYGWAGLPRDVWRFVGHVWEGKPVKGLLDPGVPLRDALALQERVHFIGFVSERRYNEGEIRDEAYYLGNWHLFATQEAVREAFRNYPLRTRSNT